jgi:hypothetical protein
LLSWLPDGGRRLDPDHIGQSQLSERGAEWCAISIAGICQDHAGGNLLLHRFPGSGVKRSPAWFETESLPGPRPVDGVRDPGTIPPADTTAKRSANSHPTCSPTNSRPPDSYPVCLPDRNTAEPLLQNAFPAWENPYHPQSMPPPDRASAGLAEPAAAPLPASPRRSRARPLPSDGGTDACGERYSEPSAPPSVLHSCALRATTTLCSSSSTVCAGRRAPRHWPGPQYMPRSASAVGLAKRGVIPQNNSTSICLFVTQ